MQTRESIENSCRTRLGRRGEAAKLAHPVFEKMITFKKMKKVLSCALLYNMYLIQKL